MSAWVPPLLEGGHETMRACAEPRRGQRGFTLVELMITVAVIAVLAAIALPAYQHYIRKSAYSELVALMAPVKTAITLCVTEQAEFDKCRDAQQLGITLPEPSAVLGSMSIDPDTLRIKVVPKAYKGLQPSEFCELQPRYNRLSQMLSWSYISDSPCVLAGYVAL